MGRGRAKAKQTKVARDLKYRPVDTDFRSLERELRGDSYNGADEPAEVPDAYVEIANGYTGDVADEPGDDDEDGDDDAQVAHR